MELIGSLLLLIVGFVLLALGANTLITGAIKIARRFHISPLLIGLTIIAFGTSLPELMVSIVAAVQGQTKIAVGNAIGSNIANIGLVIGLTAFLYPLRIKSELLKLQFPILIVVTVLVGLLLADGQLDRIDGLILFWAAFVFTLVFLQRQCKKRKEILKQEYEREIEIREKVVEEKLFRAGLELVIGLVVLLGSAEIIVRGASSVASFFGLSPLFIGLTIVAIGTSLPELATSIIGARRKEYDLVIGNVLGSNIFNMLVVLAIAAVISPFSVSYGIIIRDFSMMSFLTVLLYIFSFVSIRRRVNRITRKEGLVLLLIYVSYIFALVMVRGVFKVA